MLANLQIVEQSLNAFFGDAAKRDELAGLLRWLDQIRGGLHVLSLEQAEQLLVFIQNSVRRFVQGSDLPKPLESRALATAVGALENYLQHLAHGQAGEVAPLLEALADAPVQPQSPVQAAAVVEAESGARLLTGEDQELLEVFLEEAQEVLDIMRDNLEVCQLHPDSREPLIIIRRGFHTLKGSGRMVGLSELGEVAWAVERALNKWLQDSKPASSGLLRFIGQAARAFTGWVDALANRGGVVIEAGELMAAAQRIENGMEPEAPPVVAEPPAVPEPSQPSAPPAEEKVTIGEVTLSPTLFNIASAEARQNVVVLQRQLAALRAMPAPVVPYDFMRAAHTLAGVNRTMGFPAVVELALALENWLQAHMDHAAAPDEAQLELLEQAVAELDVMTQAICARQAPQAQTELAQRLVADKERPAHATPTTAGEQSPTEPVVEVPHIDEAPPAPVAYPSQAAVAEVPAEKPSGAEKPQTRDEVDEQLLPIFLEEADELFPKIGAGLRAWREQPLDEARPQSLKRLLHTLKGSSRMAGAMDIGELAHGMEARVMSAAQKDKTAEFWEALENGLDSISAKLESLRSGAFWEQPVAASEPHADEQAPVVECKPETPPPEIPERVAERRTERRAPEVVVERALPGNMLRVRADVVDRLVNEAGEISVARSRMETEMRAFKEGLLELTGSVARLRAQLREVEIQAESQMQARISQTGDSAEQFDPLEFDRFTRLQELTRFMNESVHDVQTVQLLLLKNLDETAAAMSAQARMNRELQQSLMNVRMVPFASISDRLYRIVRQTAKELDKRANLELSGSNVEVDRSVLEKMTAPFEHLLRNAIAHGLEDEQARKQAGKNPIGEVRLSLRHEGNEVVFEFGDDGAGLDFAALHEKAQAKGLLRPGEEASDDQLAQLIFVSGMSTAAKVTEVAGRGIGMDVVRSEIAALGGRIDVNSVRGHGTRFIIHLPLTLAVTQTLMVRASDRIYALPSTMVEQVRQVKPAELAQFYRDHRVEWQGKSYPFHYLPHLLGDTARAPESLPRNAVLLLRSGEQRIALHVEELIGNQEAVVKNIGPQLSRLAGIAGATVLGNGKAVLILNPAQLAQRIGTAIRKPEQAAAEKLHTQPLVMVVDDSLTVRKVTTRLLQRAGYQVVTAKDGVDALEQLGELTPAVMLLDIEMPRMDGFELTKHMRRDARTQNLPIIMITSRTAAKHRDYAMQLGVNAYLGKPYQEEELLRQIAGFIAASGKNPA
jgi:chemosensory pili system protein ChpA (sensor histidine kinase/response regulator)